MLSRAVEILLGGGVVIYPTETLYAVGCLIRSEAAVERIAAFKGRGEVKPFPVIIGTREQLDQAAGEGDEAARLMNLFWPGPLSVLLSARPDLPARLTNAEGLISVRWTPHPKAQRLCLECRSPLVATSANTSGRPAVARSCDLEPELADRADGVLSGSCSDGFGLPSTVVRPLSGDRVGLVREGAIPAGRLEEEGFLVESL
jgi:L-threonylcarbamoyladenylate synthase